MSRGHAREGLAPFRVSATHSFVWSGPRYGVSLASQSSVDLSHCDVDDRQGYKKAHNETGQPQYDQAD